MDGGAGVVGPNLGTCTSVDGIEGAALLTSGKEHPVCVGGNRKLTERFGKAPALLACGRVDGVEGAELTGDINRLVDHGRGDFQRGIAGESPELLTGIDLDRRQRTVGTPQVRHATGDSRRSKG